MNKLTVFALGAVTGVALAGAAVAGKKKEAVLWPADQIKWAEVPMPKGMPPPPEGAKKPVAAALWGDMTKGAHGALVKFEDTTEHPMHSHSAELKGVIISGTFWIQPEGGEKVKLGPGSYYSVPGGHMHTSGSEGAVTLFQIGSGKFDLKPAAAAKKPM